MGSSWKAFYRLIKWFVWGNVFTILHSLLGLNSPLSMLLVYRKHLHKFSALSSIGKSLGCISIKSVTNQWHRLSLGTHIFFFIGFSRDISGTTDSYHPSNKSQSRPINPLFCQSECNNLYYLYYCSYPSHLHPMKTNRKWNPGFPHTKHVSSAVLYVSFLHEAHGQLEYHF